MTEKAATFFRKIDRLVNLPKQRQVRIRVRVFMKATKKCHDDVHLYEAGKINQFFEELKEMEKRINDECLKSQHRVSWMAA